jgi:hypothetical protein
MICAYSSYRGRAAGPRAERVDVVRDETGHRGHGRRITRGVEWGPHLPGREEPVALGNDRPKELGVGVRVFLAGVRVGAVHHFARVDGHRPPLGPGGVRGNGVAEVPTNHALEGGHFAGTVQVAEQVVERTVLEHRDDDVVEPVGCVRVGHSFPSVDGRRWAPRPAPGAPSVRLSPSPGVCRQPRNAGRR